MTEDNQILITIGTKWNEYKAYLNKKEGIRVEGQTVICGKVMKTPGYTIKEKPTFEGFMDFIGSKEDKEQENNKIVEKLYDKK